MAPAERPRAKLPQTARRAVAGVYPSNARPALPREAKRAAPDYGVPGDPDWRSVDWPAHTHRVEVAGREINYVDIGDGVPEPVVFVHGLGGNWQNWLENIPCAAQDRRVIAMDLPGFGHSEMPAEDISISHYARLLDELVERLGVEHAAIVGN